MRSARLATNPTALTKPVGGLRRLERQLRDDAMHPPTRPAEQSSRCPKRRGARAFDGCGRGCRLVCPERQEVHAGLVFRAGRELIAFLGTPELWCAEFASNIGRMLVEVPIYLTWMAPQDPSHLSTVPGVWQRQGEALLPNIAGTSRRGPDARSPGIHRPYGTTEPQQLDNRSPRCRH